MENSERRCAPRWVWLWLAALSALMVGAWCVVGASLGSAGLGGSSSSSGSRESGGDASLDTTDGRQLVSGTWGQLEVVPIVLSPPPEFLGRALVDGPIVWRFPVSSRQELRELFARAGVDGPAAARLLADAASGGPGRGYVVRPEREEILGLANQTRRKLYLALHAVDGNREQRDGFRFRGDSIEQWFGRVRLSARTRALVEPLIYRNECYLFFSDLRAVAPSITSGEEVDALLQAVSRESTCMLRVSVPKQGDLEAAVEYWGVGNRESAVRPILEAAGEHGVDVAQLLPPFARQRLYTYPSSQAAVDGVHRDCHWTALNFFADEPDDRYGDPVKTFEGFERDYYQVEKPRFGDLIHYASENHEPIHSATYIAGDVVFTKNGTTALRPWMFMKLEDMRHYYPRLGKVRVGYFRRRGTF